MTTNTVPTTRVTLLQATRNQLLTVLNYITGEGYKYEDAPLKVVQARLKAFQCEGIEVETDELSDETGMYSYIEPIWAVGVKRNYGVAGPV